MTEPPIYIKPSLVKFFEKLAKEKEISLEELYEKPNKYLLDTEYMTNPEMLVNTVFELESEEEVLIDENAAQAIVKQEAVPLIALYDQQKILVSYEVFLKDFKNSKVFDFITPKKI